MTTPGPAGSNGFLYFAVGALVIAVGVLGYMYFDGQFDNRSSIERAADAIGDAADDLGDSARDAARDIQNRPAPAPN